MTLVSLIDDHPADAVAVIDGDHTLTYGELRARRDETKAGLVAAGAHVGDRIGIVCGNSTASVVSLLGVARAGMVSVPLNPASPPAELKRELDAVGAAVLLTDRPVADDVHRLVATPAATTVAGVEALPPGDDAAPVDVNESELAVLMFTSGTAGSPKAAMLTHRNLDASQLGTIDAPGSDVDDQAVMLAVLPLSHMYGLNVSLFTILRAGGTVVLQDGFDPARSIELVDRHGVTLFAGVPPMWRAFIDLPGVRADAFDGISRITSGASPLAPSLWHEFRDVFGFELSEGYGLTETSPVVTTHLGIPVKPGSVGKPIAGVEVKVVDHDGRPVPTHDSGEVLVRGPNVFAGYWQDEEATKAVLDDDGWLHTGDIGVLSDDGYLSLVDRAKDLIIVSGFNVYPFEVEAVLIRHPSIAQAVVIGRDDERRGERVVAFVIARDGENPPVLDDVVDFCRAELARYKCPSELHVVEELPIAPTGKRIRRELD